MPYGCPYLPLSGAAVNYYVSHSPCSVKLEEHLKDGVNFVNLRCVRNLAHIIHKYREKQAGHGTERRILNYLPLS